LIEDAILVLKRHYTYEASADIAFILAIRHQREAGYSEPAAGDDE
jgi:hypothetical protein